MKDTEEAKRTLKEVEHSLKAAQEINSKDEREIAGLNDEFLEVIRREVKHQAEITSLKNDIRTVETDHSRQIEQMENKLATEKQERRSALQ